MLRGKPKRKAEPVYLPHTLSLTFRGMDLCDSCGVELSLEEQLWGLCRTCQNPAEGAMRMRTADIIKTALALRPDLPPSLLQVFGELVASRSCAPMVPTVARSPPLADRKADPFAPTGRREVGPDAEK
jgi:hypothetical protein